MAWNGAQTDGTPVRDGAEHRRDSSGYHRRGFVRGVGAAVAVGGLSGLPAVSTATAGGTGGEQSGQLSQRWSTELSGTVQDYLVESDLLYVVTGDGAVEALDVETGRETGRTDLGNSVRPYGLAKAGGYLAVGLASGRLKLVDAESLSTELTIPFDGTFRGVTAKGGAVFLATSSAVQRVALPGGATQWRFEKRDVSPIWATSEGIGFNARPKRPGAGSNFYLLSGNGGEPVWKGGVSAGGLGDKTGNWLRAEQFWDLTELDSHLVAAGVGFVDGYVCFDKFTGDTLWTAGGGGNVNRAVRSSHGVVHQEGSSVVSRALDTGESQWKTDAVVPHAKGMGSHDGSLVVFGTRTRDDADVLMALDPVSRAINWEREVDGPVGLVSTVGNVAFGVNLETDEIRAYLPENTQVDIPERATPTPAATTGSRADAGTPATDARADAGGATTAGPDATGQGTGEQALQVSAEPTDPNRGRDSFLSNNSLKVITTVATVLAAIAGWLGVLQKRN